MGLSGPTLEQIATMAQISETDPYQIWRDGIEGRRISEWQVCTGCMPALSPFLDQEAAPPQVATIGAPSGCGKCGGMNPASQWHCSHCGNVQWGLIGFSLLVAGGLALWTINLATWWGRGIAGVVALVFLGIGVSSIRDARRDRRYR